jgi:hypothetical protein
MWREAETQTEILHGLWGGAEYLSLAEGPLRNNETLSALNRR